jgi:ABC-2 type transport system permease protein
MKHGSADMQTMFQDPAASTAIADKALADMKQSGTPPGQAAPVERFLTELKTFVNTPASQGPPGAAQGEWQPLKIMAHDVARQQRGPDNAFNVTFPQGVIWGLIGCVMTFGISLVTERTHGTLVRLRMAPLTRTQILGGKALACFVSILIVEVMLLGVALAMGVRPGSYPLLALAGLSAAVCFVGFMMLIASLGKTEQSASGAGWAILMPLSMLGGAMVPTFVMPLWMQTVGLISPIRWSLMAMEGAVWRNFTLAEMALPCAILISVGVVCFALGTRGLREA